MPYFANNRDGSVIQENKSLKTMGSVLGIGVLAGILGYKIYRLFRVPNTQNPTIDRPEINAEHNDNMELELILLRRQFDLLDGNANSLHDYQDLRLLCRKMIAICTERYDRISERNQNNSLILQEYYRSIIALYQQTINNYEFQITRLRETVGNNLP